MSGSLLTLQLSWAGGVAASTRAVIAAASARVLPSASAQGLELAWPVSQPRISQPFGPTTNPLEPPYNGYAHFHPGVDLAAPAGTPVRAAADGAAVVVRTDPTGAGYGEYVVLQNPNGTDTVYAHLSEVLVKPSSSVRSGQVLGLVGTTGNSTGPHLHFEYWVQGRPVDPLAYLPTPS